MSNKIKYFFCPKCGNIPSLSIYDKGYVGYTCDCQHKGVMLASEMLNIITSQDAKSFQISCPFHNKDYFAYCKDCKQHICFDCSITHDNHSIENLDNLNARLHLNEIQFNIAQCKEQIEMNKLMKERLISRLKLEIIKVENTYERTSQLNNIILSFMQLITDSYKQSNTRSNYHIIQNIIMNNNFNIDDEHVIKGDSLLHDVNSMLKVWEDEPVMAFPQVPPRLCTLNMIRKVEKCQEMNKQIRKILPLRNGNILLCEDNSSVFTVVNGVTLEIEYTFTITDIDSKIRDIIELPDNKIICCCLASCMYIINIDNSNGSGSLYKKINADKGDVLCALNNNKFAFSSNGCNVITIYKAIEPFSIDTTFNDAHLGDVYSMIQLKDGRLVSGAGTNEDDIGMDDCIKFWDIERNVPLNEYAITNVVCYTENCLREVGKKLIIGNCDSCIIVSLETYLKEFVIKHPMMKYTFSVLPMEGCDNSNSNSFIVISCNDNNKNTLLQFDTCTGETITAIEIPGTKGDFSTQSIWVNNQTLTYFEWNYVYYYKVTTNKD